MTKDLTLLSYTCQDEQVQGLVFIFHDFNIAYTLEQELDSNPKARAEQISTFDNFKEILC